MDALGEHTWHAWPVSQRGQRNNAAYMWEIPLTTREDKHKVPPFILSPWGNAPNRCTSPRLGLEKS